MPSLKSQGPDRNLGLIRFGSSPYTGKNCKARMLARMIPVMVFEGMSVIFHLSVYRVIESSQDSCFVQAQTNRQ